MQSHYQVAKNRANTNCSYNQSRTPRLIGGLFFMCNTILFTIFILA